MNRTIILPIIALSLVSFGVSAHSDSKTTHPSVSKTEQVKSDAVELILEDHGHIRQMLTLLEKNLDSNINESRATFKKLKDFLLKHETMEQKIWYPVLEKHDNLKKIIVDLKQAELNASDALKKIDGIKDDKEWVDEVKNLIKDVKSHAKEEETELFPEVRKSFDQPKLEEIGEKLKKYKSKHHMHY